MTKRGGAVELIRLPPPPGTENRVKEEIGDTHIKKESPPCGNPSGETF